MSLLYTKKYQTEGTINSYIKDLDLKHKFMNTSPLVEKEEPRINLSAPVGRWNPTAYGWSHEERLEAPNDYMKMGGAGAALPKGFRVDGMASLEKAKRMRIYEDVDKNGEKIIEQYPQIEEFNRFESSLYKDLPKNLGSLGVKAEANYAMDKIPSAPGFSEFVTYKGISRPSFSLGYNVNKGVPLKNGYLGVSASAEKGLGKNENYRVGANINAEKYFTPKLSGNLEGRYDKGKYDSNYNIRAGLKYRF